MLSSIEVINTHTHIERKSMIIFVEYCYERKKNTLHDSFVIEDIVQVSKQIKHHTRVRHVPIKAKIKDKLDKRNNQIEM